MISSKTITVDYPFYKIVADGGMSAEAIGEGRFIPALIIDVEGNKEISELIQLHKRTPPGDTFIQWSFPKTFFSPKSIYLNVEFTKPMEVKFGIDFNLSGQYSLVDGIIQSRAFYLMTGNAQNRVSQEIDSSILIEVPSAGFDNKWNDMLVNILVSKYRDMRASKKDAKNLAAAHIKSMREVWNLRRPL